MIAQNALKSACVLGTYEEGLSMENEHNRYNDDERSNMYQDVSRFSCEGPMNQDWTRLGPIGGAVGNLHGEVPRLLSLGSVFWPEERCTKPHRPGRKSKASSHTSFSSTKIR